MVLSLQKRRRRGKKSCARGQRREEEGAGLEPGAVWAATGRAWWGGAWREEGREEPERGEQRRRRRRGKLSHILAGLIKRVLEVAGSLAKCP